MRTAVTSAFLNQKSITPSAAPVEATVNQIHDHDSSMSMLDIHAATISLFTQTWVFKISPCSKTSVASTGSPATSSGGPEP